MKYSVVASTALAALATAAPQTSKPTGIDLTVYWASDSCQFTDATIHTYPGCQNFPTGIKSFTNSPVNVDQITIYANQGCIGAGTTLHMDYAGCQNASIPAITGLHEPASSTAASYCIPHAGVACP